MRTLIAAAVAGLTVAAAAADDPKPKADPPAKKLGRPKKPEPTLKVGDKAPVLKADKWLQGAAVSGFEPGKVYVVEFWATWCGPCIAMMPHLADLAEEYAPKGVTVVGFSSKAQDELEKNQKFVEKRGPKLGYRFAWCDTDETHKNWMNAAGQGGIPCSFVVDKDGKVAYIGHPVFLDEVLPKVVAGTWDAAKGKEELEAADKDFDKAFEAVGERNPEDGLKKLADFAAKRPGLGNNPYLTGPKLSLLLKAKKFDEAKALADGVIAKAAKRDDTSALTTVASVLSEAKDQPEVAKLAVQAADANLTIAGDDSLPAVMTAQAAYAAAGETDKAKGFAAKAVGLAEKAVKGDKDFQGQLRLASVYKAAGDADKAKAAAQKALDNAPPAAKAFVTREAKKYGAEPKKDGDKDK